MIAHCNQLTCGQDGLLESQMAALTSQNRNVQSFRAASNACQQQKCFATQFVVCNKSVAYAQVYKLMCDTHLVVLHVPALDHLVKPSREHVRVAITHRQSCHLQHHDTMTSSVEQGYDNCND